ncbi:MAG: alpha/beta hydrolase [Candidatus Levybacteria bacterium]|nr:alpha/beta hydrolase [Candidatus Levybacteria bacterium]
MLRKLPGSIAKSLFSHDGINIYYDVNLADDNKKFLVFLHGLGGDLTSWNAERQSFKNLGYSTIAVDLRGHGLSERPREEKRYALNNFALDILEIIIKEQIKDAVVIGHCFGGMVALTLEGTYPRTSKALILIDTSYKPPYFSKVLTNHALFNKMLSLVANHAPDVGNHGHNDFSKFIGTGDFNVKRIISDILHTSLHSYFMICENLLGYDATTLLEKIIVPTLVIEGTKDHIFPPKVAKDLEKRIKTAEIDFIEGANHVLVINNPADLVKDMHKFLQKINFNPT